MEVAVDALTGAISESVPITIYGDYDADGVAATSILVGLLRQAGATCDWFIPDRITDGYGLNEEAVHQIAGRGTGLLVTVDCGVASPSEVETAKRLGMGVVVTDHHQFGEVLPDCPILHPVISRYPFEWLAGAGVAAKFASALRQRLGLDPAGDEEDLDLVALATVADVMPLVGENRRLVREGLNVIRRTRRVGMGALLREAGVEPASIDSSDLGFRLGPRVNAVGRMYRADAGVELFLTEDPERAAEIGRELTLANKERRRVQEEVESAARRALAESGDGDRSVVVVAGEGWHPGVVGIVASHLARDEGMPAVVIGLEDGVGKGSARSVPGVDLHAAIAASAESLETFGGHAAAAGVTVREDRIEDFHKALDRAVSDVTGGLPSEMRESVDIFLGGPAVGLELAEQIEGLGPFGSGNPVVSALVPSARIEDPVGMGEGKHLRFTLVSGGHRSRAVWFGRSSPPDDPGNGFDVMGELSLNHWKGSVEPSFRVTGIRPVMSGAVEPLAVAEPDEWWERFELALAGQADRETSRLAGAASEVVRHRNSSLATVAELVSSGESVLVVTAEAYRRWISLGGSSLGRFGPDGPVPSTGAWFGSPEGALGQLESRLTVVDYETLASKSPPIGHFENVVLFDPPASESEFELVRGLGGLVHQPDDPPSRSFALAAAAERHDPVPSLRLLFAKLRDEGPLRDEALRTLLAGGDQTPRAPERAATLVRILDESGIAQSDCSGTVRELGVVSSEEVDLERSEEFRRQSEIHREQVTFLRR